MHAHGEVTFLDFIRDCFIMADRCAHKSQVSWWRKTIHNTPIKGETQRGKGKGTELETGMQTERRIHTHQCS